MVARLIEPVLRLFLLALDKLFSLTRSNVTPLYPYDMTSQTIRLPDTINNEIKRLVAGGNTVEAVKLVSRLTGAGLRVAKNYIDGLAEPRKNRR